jgi:predicted DNA-binding ribbon-helix-helix protein
MSNNKSNTTNEKIDFDDAQYLLRDHIIDAIPTKIKECIRKISIAEVEAITIYGCDETFRTLRRHIKIADKKTGLSIDPYSWGALDEICEKENITQDQFLTLISKFKTPDSTLASATRTFVLGYFRQKSV